MNLPAQPPNPPGRLASIVQRHPVGTLSLLLVLLVIACIAIIASPLSRETELFRRLAEPGYARGVLTFIFAVGTMSIGFLIALAALVLPDDAEGSRFNRGKEVFVVLIGILGTILGFYYGNEVKAASPLEVAGFELSVEEGELRGSATILGGKPGYEYAISFEPEIDGLDAMIGRSEGGLVVATVALPGETAGRTITAKITVIDAEGATVTAEASLNLPEAEPDGAEDGSA